MIWFILIVFITAILFATILKNKGGLKFPSVNLYKPKPLMTANEHEFFNRLVNALPNHFIFPQVCLGAILQGDSKDPKERNRIRFTFSQKMADFVIYNKEQTIVAIIELDDRTHNKEKDEKRDAMLEQAGYRVIRFESKNKPSIVEIANIIGS